MSKLKVIDEMQPPKKRRGLMVKDLAVRELFCFLNGYPPNIEYPRIFYMKLGGDSYIQLSGPREGEIYYDYGTNGPVRRVHGILRITHEETA